MKMNNNHAENNLKTLYIDDLISNLQLHVSNHMDCFKLTKCTGKTKELKSNSVLITTLG